MADERLISDRQRIEQDSFFARMEEFGFFDTVEEHLPEEFTAVFEIARIIENLEHPLGEKLAPVLALTGGGEQPHDVIDYIPNLPTGEEYEADLIRNVLELPSIYPHQFLLPDSVFYQKLVERSLWLPRPHPPQNYRYQTESDMFAPDHRKQKVYVLFDISRSMNLHYRIHLAKAIAYLFLQRNMKELGTVYFRTFAENVDELRTATDIPSFNELLSHIMHVKALGRGTLLQKAVLTAIEDIKTLHALADTEILCITDGAAHLDMEKLREMMGTTIRLNTVKIGNESITADAKFVQYHLHDANTDDAKRLKALYDKRFDLESQKNSAGSSMRKSMLDSELSHVNRQIASLTERVAQYFSDHYGSEIMELSEVFVHVDDLDSTVFLTLDDKRRSELEELTESLINALHNERLSDDIKRAATLFDHLELLLEHNQGEENEKLRRHKEELEQMFRRIISTDGDDDVDDIHLSSFDTKQLRNLLIPSVNRSSYSLGRMVRIIWRAVRKWFANRRQIRKARVYLRRRKLY